MLLYTNGFGWFKKKKKKRLHASHRGWWNHLCVCVGGGRWTQNLVCICPWRVSAWAFSSCNSTWMKSVKVFLISIWGKTTKMGFYFAPQNDRVSALSGFYVGHWKNFTWLFFSARRDSTSSLRLNGLPTKTVILCKKAEVLPTTEPPLQAGSEVKYRMYAQPLVTWKYLSSPGNVGRHVR